MEGQVVDIDFAIAAGLFVTGLVTAFTLGFTLQQPESEGFSQSLERSADSAFSSFKDQAYWSIEKNVVFENSNEPSNILRSKIIRKSEKGTFSAKSSEGDIIPIEEYDNYLYLTINESPFKIYRSDGELENSSNLDSTEYSATGFSTDYISGEFRNERIEAIEIDETQLINYIEPDSGSRSVNEKNGSIKIDFNDISIIASGVTTELWIGSFSEEVEISAESSLDSLNIIGGSSHQLNTSKNLEGHNPFYLNNGSRYLVFTGSSNTWNLQSADSGSTVINFEGPTYVSYHESETDARKRALINQNSSTIVRKELEGLDRQKAREILETGTRLKLGISSSTNFNISYQDISAGESIPLTGNILGRNYDVKILRPNTSIERGQINTRIWR